jgi:nucleotide-binding universal stress UspA family protein
MLCSILVALDGSAHSQPAIELSIRWAKQTGAKLTGMGIIDQPMHSATGAESPSESVPEMQGHWKDAADRVGRYVDEFSQLCEKADVSATVLNEVGVPFERIVLESQRHDLILMSHHFETPESSGDTFMQLLQRSPRPVVAVPKTLSMADTIVIAYDGSLQSSRALQMLVASGLYKSKSVHVVSIDPDLEAAAHHTALAVDFLALHHIEAEGQPLASTDPPADVLLDQIAKLEAGLLVMGAHKTTILKEFFVGSVTKTLLKESLVPLFLDH